MSEIRENVSERRMSSLAIASDYVRQLGGSAGSSKARITKAWRKLPKWTFSRVRDVYYQDQRVRLGADELADLREVADADALAQEARDEFRQLQQRIARLEAALGISDPEFFGPTLDALRGVSRVQDRPLD